MKSIKDIEVEDKKVLVRVDFNLPPDIRTGAITDDSRIRAALPTIRYLVANKAKIILCSHRGRPDGKVVKKLRMIPIAKRLSQLLHLPVSTVSDCIGVEVAETVSKLEAGQILLLENLRFHAEEEANDADFARELAGLADIYIDDAFSTAHRTHASIVGVAEYIPAFPGFLMEKELNTLNSILAKPEHPFAALLGGAKVSDKIGLIKNILSKIDVLLIGGGMAASFLKVQGYEIGQSSVDDEDKHDFIVKLFEDFKKNNISLSLPVDVIVTDNFNDHNIGEIVGIAEIQPNKHVADIGPKTIETFSSKLRECQTIFWNGPMGVYEIPEFSNGTKTIAKLLADIDAVTIIGGGSTTEVVEEMNLANKMSHVSTGGGASLKFLEGKSLPGIAVLQDERL